MTGFEIEESTLDQHSLNTWAAGDPRIRNWPVVYLLDNPAEIYVGESLNTVARIRQHKDSQSKKELAAVCGKAAASPTSRLPPPTSRMDRIDTGEPRGAAAGDASDRSEPHQPDPPTAPARKRSTESSRWARHSLTIGASDLTRVGGAGRP